MVNSPQVLMTLLCSLGIAAAFLALICAYVTDKVSFAAVTLWSVVLCAGLVLLAFGGARALSQFVAA